MLKGVVNVWCPVSGDLSRASLMAVGASNTERKESRAAHRTVRREQRREDPPELSPIIGTALDRLVVRPRRRR